MSLSSMQSIFGTFLNLSDSPLTIALCSADNSSSNAFFYMGDSFDVEILSSKSLYVWSIMYSGSPSSSYLTIAYWLIDAF